ncbi:MAG: beta-propeller domain-containing protein [Ornithinimicrobium sp.]
MRHLPALLAIPLFVSACSAQTDPSESTQSARPAPAAPPAAVGAVAFAPFSSCEDLLDYYVKGARDLVGPYGLSGSMEFAEPGMSEDAAAGSDESFAADGGTQQSGGEDENFSGTNNQEEGVDEADTVKTDGKIIAAVARDRLHIVDVAAGEIVGTVDINDVARGAYQSEIVLNGDTLVLISTGTADERPFWRPWVDSLQGSDDSLDSTLVPGRQRSPRTTITRIDISDPTSPTVLGSTRMEGSYRSARMIDDSVRIVLESDPPGLRFTSPKNGSITAEREAAQENLSIVDNSTIDDWIPHLETIAPDGSRGEVQPLADCSDVNRPAIFSGWSTLSVITLDVSEAGAQPLAPSSTVAVVASGETIYASTDRLIVATSPWGRWAAPFEAQIAADGSISTSLHTFDISDPERTDYVASGEVDGTLINQFALSEVDGVIRVATTSGASWNSGPEASQSTLTMLAEQDEELAITGSVGGLGKTEQITSVRFLNPELAAVVTFRQTDPLYLIDTSDPTEPVVTGELKIPGYSAYLHPLDDTRLLGIGQEADPDSGTEEGLQVSLFDISDLSNPQRVDQLTWPGGYSPVEYDHRAFTAWPATGQFFLPAEIYDWACEDDNDEVCGDDGSAEQFAGVVTGSVEGQQLIEGERLPTFDSSTQWSPPAERTLVIGDELWTVHYEGLNRYDLETLTGGLAVSWKTEASAA